MEKFWTSQKVQVHANLCFPKFIYKSKWAMKSKRLKSIVHSSLARLESPWTRPHKIRHSHKFTRAVPSGHMKKGVFQEMLGKCLELVEKWRVFHIALCVVCVLLCWQWEGSDQCTWLLKVWITCRTTHTCCRDAPWAFLKKIKKKFLNLWALLWLCYAFYASIYRKYSLMNPTGLNC